jgi:hypothetical protein
VDISSKKKSPVITSTNRRTEGADVLMLFVLQKPAGADVLMFYALLGC